MTKLCIPTVWRIDVEPDQHRPAVGQGSWAGFVDTFARVNRLKEALHERTGRLLRPTWLVRMDPDIERCFGRADFVVHRYPEIFDELTAREDPLGIHVHHYRWNPERDTTFSDYADTGWTTQCLTVASDAFRTTFGKPVQLSSHGGYFLTEALLDHAVALGIRIDLTVEPGLGPKKTDPSFGAYATAPSADFVACPRHPYYPSRRSMTVASPSSSDSRPMLIVPLTSYDYRTALRPWHREVARRLLGRPRLHSPLNPWKRWPSPKVYWDLVARAVDEQPTPYLALATRTDDPASGKHQNVWDLFDYLPEHPIAERLQFVDPLGTEIHALAAP